MALVALFFTKIVCQFVIYPLFVHLTSHLYIFYTNPFIIYITRHDQIGVGHAVVVLTAALRRHSLYYCKMRILQILLQHFLQPHWYHIMPPLVQAIYKSVRFTQHNNRLLHHQSKVFKLKGVFKYILPPSYYSTAHLPSTRCQALIMQS